MSKKTVLNLKIKKGFTLIEIMVVVAIIGVLAAIAVMSGESGRKLARDNQRVSDLQLIQLKLEVYHDQKGVYPAKITDLVPNYFASLQNIPKDPQTKADYSYSAFTLGSGATNCGTYHLGALLENKSSGSLQKAKHLKMEGLNGRYYKCGGSSVDFDATDATNNPNLWYDVISPNDFQQSN